MKIVNNSWEGESKNNTFKIAEAEAIDFGGPQNGRDSWLRPLVICGKEKQAAPQKFSVADQTSFVIFWQTKITTKAKSPKIYIWIEIKFCFRFKKLTMGEEVESKLVGYHKISNMAVSEKKKNLQNLIYLERH